MDGKIVNVNGFSVGPPEQHAYLLVAVTDVGNVLISQGDGKWENIGPKKLEDPDNDHPAPSQRITPPLQANNQRMKLMELETINKLYLELSQFATAKNCAGNRAGKSLRQ